MSLARSWQFVGGIHAWPYRLYDALRRGVNRRLVRFLTRELDVVDAIAAASSPGRRVLEAGSGTAFATSLFAEQHRTCAAVCLDLDPEALALARRRDGRILPVAGDLANLPFRDEAFTLVFSSSTLEHLDDPLPTLLEMTRVCAGAGRVFVGVPYARGPLAFQPLIRNTGWGIWLGPVFSRRSLDRLMRRAGLRARGHLLYFWRFFIGVLAEKQPLPDGTCSPVMENPAVEVESREPFLQAQRDLSRAREAAHGRKPAPTQEAQR